MPATDGEFGQSRVYRRQGATEITVASGGRVVVEAGGVLDASAGAVTLPCSQMQGRIDLGPYIFAARQLASAETLTTASGSVVNPDGAAAVALVSTADQSLHLNFASAVVAGIKLPPIAVPTDLSTAGGMTIGLFGESIGAGTASGAEAGVVIR